MTMEKNGALREGETPEPERPVEIEPLPGTRRFDDDLVKQASDRLLNNLGVPADLDKGTLKLPGYPGK